MLLTGNRKGFFQSISALCVNTAAEFFYSNWKIKTKEANWGKNCKPYFPWITWCGRNIICWILGLFGRESGEKEGAELVKEMGWRKREGAERARRGRGREGGKKEKKRPEREKPRLRIFCIPWVAKQKSLRRKREKKKKKLWKVDTVKNNG